MIEKNGENIMLKKFTVKNFRGFENEITLDLSSNRDYTFNDTLIKNDLVNKSLIFGRNGSGKSNLGLAIFDLTWQLTENKKINPIDVIPYINGNSKPNTSAYFKYVFQFGNDEVIYEYEKYSYLSLKYERLYLNGIKLVEANFDTNTYNVEIEQATPFMENLKKEQKNGNSIRNDQSLIRLIYRNAILNENSPVKKLMTFVEKMLWFRSLNGNNFIGYKKDPQYLSDMIATEENLQNLQNFFNDNGLDYKLSFVTDPVSNKTNIMASFKGATFPLESISSTGTDALLLFYCWSLEFKNISFLYLDEFDAYYHYETAEYVLNIINKYPFQSIITTHNTSLMSNRLTRPDCAFILTNKYVKNLCNCTEKEIREAHNLEKMYKGGQFDD